MAETKKEMATIYIFGKKYDVPAELTIMNAMEYAGYQLKRGCGCRNGFCDAGRVLIARVREAGLVNKVERMNE